MSGRIRVVNGSYNHHHKNRPQQKEKFDKVTEQKRDKANDISLILLKKFVLNENLNYFANSSYFFFIIY